MNAAIDYVNSTYCGAFDDGRCIVSFPPCIAALGSLVPSCNERICQLLPPAAWTQVTLVQGNELKVAQVGAAQCRWVTGCVAWRVDVDGSVTVSGEGQSTVTMLSADDLAEVDAALRSARLRSEEQRSFSTCPEPIIGPFVSLAIERGLELPSSGGIITGCLSADPVQEELQRIVSVVTRY